MFKQKTTHNTNLLIYSEVDLKQWMMKESKLGFWTWLISLSGKDIMSIVLIHAVVVAVSIGIQQSNLFTLELKKMGVVGLLFVTVYYWHNLYKIYLKDIE